MSMTLPPRNTMYARELVGDRLSSSLRTSWQSEVPVAGPILAAVEWSLFDRPRDVARRARGHRPRQ